MHNSIISPIHSWTWCVDGREEDCFKTLRYPLPDEPRMNAGALLLPNVQPQHSRVYVCRLRDSKVNTSVKYTLSVGKYCSAHRY